MQPVSSTTFGTRTHHHATARCAWAAQLDIGPNTPSTRQVPRTHASERRWSCCDHRQSRQSFLSGSPAASRHRRPAGSLNALPVDGVAETVQQIASLDHAAVIPGAHSALLEVAQHLSLAYERVTLPCSSMNCGDAIYRRSVHKQSDICSWHLTVMATIANGIVLVPLVSRSLLNGHELAGGGRQCLSNHILAL